MSEMSTYDEWKELVEPFLISKLEEFHLLGLERLKEDELWAFAKENFIKKKEELKCHRIVGHLMSLSINDYLNKLRIDMFKGVDVFKEEQPFL